MYLFLSMSWQLHPTIASYKLYASQTNKFSNIVYLTFYQKKKKKKEIPKTNIFFFPEDFVINWTQQYEQNGPYTCNMKIYKIYNKKQIQT